MYKGLSIYNSYNMINYYSSDNQKNLILEPLSCILKLILFQFQNEGSKISVYNNSIHFSEPGIIQGFLRSYNGDCREDLHMKIIKFYSKYKKRLEPLIKFMMTMPHSSIYSHYISMMMDK